MHEFLPTNPKKILKSHATIVQNPLVHMRGLAIRSRRPQKARHGFDNLTSLVFALSEGLFRFLALRQIDYESNTIVPVTVKARQANEYWNAATVLSVILLLERSDGSPRLQLP